MEQKQDKDQNSSAPIKAVQIIAEPSSLNPALCKFKVDHLLFDGTLRCTSPEEAQGSPLMEGFFQLPQISEVVVNQNTLQVLLHAVPSTGWREVAKEVGSVVRSMIQNGVNLFPLEFTQKFSADGADSAQASGDNAGKTKTTSFNLDETLSEVQEIKQFLHEQINPAVASHGGKIVLIDFKQGDVYLRMEGGCQGCGQASLTLQQGVEKSLKQHFPYIRNVIDVTDHSGGANPYY